MNLRGLHIPVIGNPQILNKDLQSSKLHVFSQSEVLISTFDGKNNYYHYPQNYKNLHDVNFIATFLKRIYTNNYKLFIKGDILIYSSVDSLPNVIDNDVTIDFLQQVILFISKDYEQSKF
jgi:hypothetical protein